MNLVALPVCNVAPLIEGVLDALLTHTAQPFMLSICDNASTDDTVEIIKRRLRNGPRGPLEKVTLSSFPRRRPSIECINAALRLGDTREFGLVAKLDHDYAVPPAWDSIIAEIFEERPDLKLLCPSVDPSTPKGMQFYSQGHQPLKVSRARLSEIWHYQGIAGYCHTMRWADWRAAGSYYRPLTPGAVFGSEDAEWSLRFGTGHDAKGYVMKLEGFHWNKPVTGEWEDKWKAEATFGKTQLSWEEWAAQHVPEEVRSA